MPKFKTTALAAVTCLECDETHRLHRGLCMKHYSRHRTDGTLIDFPRRIRDGEELIAEALWLGLRPSEPIAPQLRDLAPRLGVNYKALEQAWYRHRRRLAA